MQSNFNLRVFGYIWSLIFFYLGYHFEKNIFFLIALAFFFSASFIPQIYIKFRIYPLWIKFGDFVGHINSKIIIAILFFFIFTPTALILKLMGKDLLGKKLDKTAKTYFKPRTAQATSMINQY